jgi:hypothetical protein
MMEIPSSLKIQRMEMGSVSLRTPKVSNVFAAEETGKHMVSLRDTQIQKETHFILWHMVILQEWVITSFTVKGDRRFITAASLRKVIPSTKSLSTADKVNLV